MASPTLAYGCSRAKVDYIDFVAREGQLVEASQYAGMRLLVGQFFLFSLSSGKYWLELVWRFSVFFVFFPFTIWCGWRLFDQMACRGAKRGGRFDRGSVWCVFRILHKAHWVGCCGLLLACTGA